MHSQGKRAPSGRYTRYGLCQERLDAKSMGAGRVMLPLGELSISPLGHRSPACKIRESGIDTVNR